MATISIDIDDYITDIDTDDLIEELEGRGYECTREDDKEYLKNLDGGNLRDVLLEITGQGSYVSDEEILQKLKELLQV